jgi:hypothetical protein
VSPWFAGVAALWLVALLFTRRSAAAPSHFIPRHVLWLLLVPAGIVAVQFAALAADKPAEYARFALLPDTALCVAAVVGSWVLLKGRFARGVVLVATMAIVAVPAAGYLAHFVADSSSPTSRTLEAGRLQALNYGGARRLGLVAEPAPYSMPPVDLWRWELALLPRGTPAHDAARSAQADVLLRPADRMPAEAPPGFRRLDPLMPNRLLQRPAPISWAAKPIEILAVETPPVSAGAGSAAPAATSPSPTPARP